MSMFRNSNLMMRRATWIYFFCRRADLALCDMLVEKLQAKGQWEGMSVVIKYYIYITVLSCLILWLGTQARDDSRYLLVLGAVIVIGLPCNVYLFRCPRC